MELFDAFWPYQCSSLEDMDCSTHQLSRHKTISVIIFQISRTPRHWERVWQLLFWRTFLLSNSAWLLSIWWDSTPLQSNMVVMSALPWVSCSLFWSQTTKDTRIITSKSCEWCQDLVQASPWYQGHVRTKIKVSMATLLEIFPLACAGPWTCQIHG